MTNFRSIFLGCKSWAAQTAGRNKVSPILLYYATGGMLVFLALSIGLLCKPWVGDRAPLLFFVAATLIAAWFGGMGPGLLTMLIGFVAGDFFFVPPLHRFGLYNVSDGVLLLAYSMVTFVGLAAISTLHHARQREEQVKQWNKELEQRVKERTAELEAFSYSISHDLRAPIRSISSCAEIMKQDYEDRLDDDGHNLLGTMIKSSRKMDQLVSDLLKLSRISCKEMHLHTVNLSALAQSIAQDLQNAEPQRVVTLVIAPNLIAQGDEGLLRIALENLLNNAWKFTGKCHEGRITFAAEVLNGERTYCVRDNGAGFDMGLAEKLFGVFQRLHSEREFKGTGIGLAIVQRIIQRHGGRIWAQSEPNKGAAFYFTLAGESKTSASPA